MLYQRNTLTDLKQTDGSLVEAMLLFDRGLSDEELAAEEHAMHRFIGSETV